MSNAPTPPEPPTAGHSRLALNEDWAATILGLALLLLVLAGAIPAGLVP
ncbi:hypothetical protein ACIODS_15245 [Micromonospora chalcea]|nr:MULTISPECIES: hypothetical protein [Micromonospora]MBQ1046062.1 hypothetical protein [Micromonospora sp. C72]MBQ1057783.1 hypothetical protein [Micromonospora sp. C32]MBQ1065921.1 hypothetical protein [Micromonospora sp. D75]